MDLLQILTNILKTKNEIKEILGENDNIARYQVSIHNLLARLYNQSYIQGYHDRYFELTDDERWVEGPETILPYSIDPKYYESFTTEILTDIMRDVLNYRLGMKEEISKNVGTDIGNEFSTYPDYLRNIIIRVPSIGRDAGIEAADEDFEGDVDVDTPTFTYSSNRFSITTTQTQANLYYKIDSDGVETLYTGPVTISESADVYYWAKIGRNNSPKTNYQSCIYSDQGLIAFVYPPIFNQEEEKMYISTSTDGAMIEYKIDSNAWGIYTGPVLVNRSDRVIKARCFKNNEYSKTSSQNIVFGIDTNNYPDNVKCTFSDDGNNNITVTLTCATAGATIFYALNEMGDGFFRQYSSPFVESSNHFIIYVYSQKDNIRSKNILYYVWNGEAAVNGIQPVQFIPEGDVITLYCPTAGAEIYYRYGAVGAFSPTGLSSVSLRPSAPTTIYAYAMKNGLQGPESSYNYGQGSGSGTGGGSGSGKPPKPTMTLNGDVVMISAYYPIRYTVDGSDPIANGAVYNESTGVKIDTTTTVKAVCVNGSVYSDITTATFTPYGSSVSEGGGGGTIPDPYNPPGPGPGGEGGNENENILVSDCLRVSGISGISFSGTKLEYTSDGSNWIASAGNTIQSLNPETTYYLRGNTTRISFNPTDSGNIRGKVSSVVASNGTAKVFDSLFESATGLVNASGLDVSDLSGCSMKGMFKNCLSLQSSEFTISTTEVLNQDFRSMFEGCSNLRYGPIFNITGISSYGCERMFYGCSNLLRTGSFNLGTTIGDHCLDSAFYGCSNLYDITLKTGQSRSTSANSAFKNCFRNCTSLDVSNIELNLFNLDSSIYEGMFAACEGIKTFGSLSADTASASCYREMFKDCINLTSFGNIALFNLAGGCCDSMFMNCRSLKSAPALGAVQLYSFNNCYKSMFDGCSSLSYIKAMFTNNPSGGNYTGNWVRNVAEFGVFECNDNANWINLVNAFGVNAIPVGWTVKRAAIVGRIKDISIYMGMVTITADNADDIYYSVTDTEDGDVENMILYEGPFALTRSCYVNAVCKNSDGVYGVARSVYLTLDYPALVISCSNNTVKIYTPYDFRYDKIEYQLCEFQNRNNVIQGWTIYTDPFVIDQSYTIQARGSVNGNFSNVYTFDILFGLNAPVISFGNRNCQITHPNTDDYDTLTLFYKINDTTLGNPPEGWTQYTTQFVYTNYYVNDICVVSAIARVSINGSFFWSSMTSLQARDGESVTLSIPIMKKISDDSNAVILEYEGVDYPTWNRTDIKISYRFWYGGQVRYYQNTFSLADAGQYISGYIDVHARAESGYVSTDWEIYRLYYNQEQEHYDVHDPIIDIRPNSATGTMRIYFTNDSTIPVAYSVENFFWIEVTEWDSTEQRPFNVNAYNSWVQFPTVGWFDISEHAVAGIVHAKSKINNDWSNEVTKEFNNQFSITSIENPMITFIEPTTPTGPYKISIGTTYPTDLCYFRAKDGTCEWASGAVDENKYYPTYPPFLTCSRYGEELDTHLAHAIFIAYWEYAGLTSERVEAEFNDPRISTTPITPTAEIVEIKGTGSWTKAYMIRPVSNPNDGMILQYKVEQPLWNGGVVNPNKYNDWKELGLYGETIDEHLISGTFLVRAYLNETKFSESYTISFQSGYSGLAKPDVVLLEGINTDKGIRITNLNPLATNQFYVTNKVWNGTNTGTSWGDIKPNGEWNVGSNYCTDIPDALISGTFHIRSVWGNETANGDDYEYYNEGAEVNSDPPSIEVVASNSSDYPAYIRLKNNANWQVYMNIKYKMDDIEWIEVDGEGPDGPTLNKYHYTDGAGNDDYIVFNAPNNNWWRALDISKYIKKGTIIAFATDEQHSPSYHGVRTIITEYQYTKA